MPLTEADIQVLAKGFAPSVHKAIEKAIEPLRKRIAELEARPILEYAGVWDGKKTYPPGNFVSHGGSVWHTKIEATGVRPGDGSLWTLVVKKGRDAR